VLTAPIFNRGPLSALSLVRGPHGYPGPRYAPRMPANALSRPPVRLIGPRPKHGRSAAGRRSRPQPSRGYGRLEVQCHRCQTRASLPLDVIRRPRNTPVLKLEAALKCRSWKNGRYAPPVHMIKLTMQREITPYNWVHPDDDIGSDVPRSFTCTVFLVSDSK
jgi:hypothetical protein